MAIVNMKRLRIIAPHSASRRLLRELTRAGCVEIERNDEWMNDAELAQLLKRGESDSSSARAQTEAAAALEALKKYAGVKKGLFDARKPIAEEDLATGGVPEQTLSQIQMINAATKQIASLTSEISRLQGQKESLIPWQYTEIPVDFATKGDFSLHFGTVASVLNFDSLKAQVEEGETAAQLDLISSDKEQHYMLLAVHHTDYERVLETLKDAGFNENNFKNYSGTIKECIAEIDVQIADLQRQCTVMEDNIRHYAACFDEIGRAYDYFSIQSKWDDISSTLPRTQQTALLSGWVPEEETDTVAAIAEKCGCAYDFSEPEEGEEPPTLMRNNRFVQPFGQVTELYGMPAYDSLVDPNPLVALSYFIFFGMMFSDAAYGLIMLTACCWFLRKTKPEGTMKKFVTMFAIVGISTTLWGAAFGSWFGDIIPVVVERITGTSWNMPALIDPLEEPITMLLISIGIGVLHLFSGMFLSLIRMWKRRQFIDIICDILPWYAIIISAGLLFLGYNAALWVIVGGLLFVLLTAGRKKKGLGKITGGLGAIYNGLTGNLSDILSYSRLMALALSTGVVASVMNTLGNMMGNSILGWIFLALVFVIGQTFNFAISILGAFVHSCRLEFVEFFGRFYEGGGRTFQPLLYKTKYVMISKEED